MPLMATGKKSLSKSTTNSRTPQAIRSKKVGEERAKGKVTKRDPGVQKNY